jgi:hypothetical protein
MMSSFVDSCARSTLQFASFLGSQETEDAASERARIWTVPYNPLCYERQSYDFSLGSANDD